MNRIRKQIKFKRLTAALLCLCMTVSLLAGLGSFFVMKTEAEEGPTQKVAGREADPSTMDTYIEMLNFDESSRYAGRLWSDKTVFAYGNEYKGSGDDESRNFDVKKLTLTKKLDGVDGSVDLDADFLEVYSVLGSSEEVQENIPVDLILALDITNSMFIGKTDRKNDYNTHPEAYYNKELRDDGTRLSKTLRAANDLIKRVRQYSDDCRISIVVYWGTAYQMVPFVDADVKFTGYTVRNDYDADRKSKNAEAVLHYNISNAANPDENGDYVYDPVFGDHYKYSPQVVDDKDDKYTDGNSVTGRLDMAGKGERVTGTGEDTAADLGGALALSPAFMSR